jgi:hypothetical protein
MKGVLSDHARYGRESKPAVATPPCARHADESSHSDAKIRDFPILGLRPLVWLLVDGTKLLGRKRTAGIGRGDVRILAGWRIVDGAPPALQREINMRDESRVAAKPDLGVRIVFCPEGKLSR